MNAARLHHSSSGQKVKVRNSCGSPKETAFERARHRAANKTNEPDLRHHSDLALAEATHFDLVVPQFE
jgi:hypothetical protein